MTNTEIALVVGVAAVGGYLVYQHMKAPALARVAYTAVPAGGSAGSTVGNAIASFGGSALSQLGKEAGSWVGSEVSNLFG